MRTLKEKLELSYFPMSVLLLLLLSLRFINVSGLTFQKQNCSEIAR